MSASVLGNVLTANIERRIKQEHRAAAVFNVVLQRGHFVGRVVGFRAGHDSYFAIVGHGILVEQGDGFG